ncbi:uncharacterized protein LOC142976920 [Anticarsia gemmatalis]|uniref:uncharacterized protein LOC142976920 n=1 Tax=Anticarsia gemmatalis TaxID=129554 RepID=UPI003F759EF8
MTERLIEFVRQHPCLYDTKDTYYKNVARKKKLWEQIGHEINKSGDVAKNKWKGLRDNYLRYKKEVAGTTGQTTKKFTKWAWAAPLQFLDATLTDRERRSNVRQSSPETSDFPSPETPRPETPPAQIVIRSRHRNINKTESEVDKVLNYLENKKKQEYDAVDHLFASYAQTFKTLSKANQIKGKIELANLFASLESEEMGESDQISKTSPL